MRLLLTSGAPWDGELTKGFHLRETEMTSILAVLRGYGYRFPEGLLSLDELTEPLSPDASATENPPTYIVTCKAGDIHKITKYGSLEEAQAGILYAAHSGYADIKFYSAREIKYEIVVRMKGPEDV